MGCSSCLRCFLLLLAVVLGLICVAGGVVFCVLYYQFAVQMGVKALEARLSELQSQLNQSQSALMELQTQASQVSSSFDMQVEMLQSDLNQLETNVSNDLNDQITQARADFMASLDDSGINAAITTADQLKSTFVTNVATTLSNQLSQVNSSFVASLGDFTTDIDSFENQQISDWSNVINPVNARVALSGEHKTYVRFGKSTCPNNPGTSQVYNGYTSGTSWNTQGGASNFLCLPSTPEYGVSGVNTDSILYGAEYESGFFMTQNENIPCAVCSVSNRPEVIMIPAKVNCPTSWTREYFGYLHSENQGNARSSFICVDEDMEFIDGKTGNQVGSDLWIVEASCVSLPCPPYNEEAEMSCVVCSK